MAPDARPDTTLLPDDAAPRPVADRADAPDLVTKTLRSLANPRRTRL